MSERLPEFVAKKDGDQWCFVFPDFENLQVSPSLWLPIYNVDMDYIFDELKKLERIEQLEKDGEK